MYYIHTVCINKTILWMKTLGVPIVWIPRNPQFEDPGPEVEHVLLLLLLKVNIDVSKNSGTPKWMVYNGKPY